MSSGSSGNKGNVEGSQFLGNESFKVWNGADGKTEVSPSGKTRNRWNNYTLDRGSRNRSSNTWLCTRVSDGSSFTTLANVKGTFPKDLDAALDTKAQSRLVDRVRGHSFNLAVNAAQSKQLVDMVVGNLGKLGRSVLALKRGDFSTAARQLGARPRPSRLKPSDVSGRWLELQYGWLPSLADTFAAAKAYEVLTTERKTTVRASARDHVTVDNGPYGQGSCIGDVIRRIVYIYEATEQLTAARSLGLLDPLSVAWEIIPYSFVVDWFIPIGTYLDNLSVIPSLRGRFMVVKSWELVGHQQLTCTQTLPGYFGGEFCSAVQYTGTDTIRSLHSERTVLDTPPRVRPPLFINQGLHGTRIWNAVALAAQRFLS